MKKSIFSVLIVALLLSGCSGLSYMKRKHKDVRYKANPDPVATVDGKVVVKFTGVFPEKYFKKKAAMFVQPVFTWDSGSVTLDPITLKGENVKGSGATINYEGGGRYTYTDRFMYRPGMETGRVTLTPVIYSDKNVDEESRFAEDFNTTSMC